MAPKGSESYQMNVSNTHFFIQHKFTAEPQTDPDFDGPYDLQQT